MILTDLDVVFMKKEEILLSFAWLMKINLSFFVDCDVIMLWWKWDYLMNFSQWSTLRMYIPYFWTKSCGKCVDFKVKIFLNSTKMSNFQIDTVGLMQNASDKKKYFNLSISVFQYILMPIFWRFMAKVQIWQNMQHFPYSDASERCGPRGHCSFDPRGPQRSNASDRCYL